MFLAYVLGNLTGTALNNLLANNNFLSTELDLFHHSSLKWSFFENTVIEASFVIQDGQRIVKDAGVSDISLFIRVFLVTQSLFILGGIYFKHNQIFKTLLALIVIVFVFFIIWGVEMYSIIGGENEANHYFMDQVRMDSWVNMIENTSNVFYWLLIPFLWVTAYFRLTEKEV
jgi:hypothetical protein